MTGMARDYYEWMGWLGVTEMTIDDYRLLGVTRDDYGDKGWLGISTNEWDD